MSPSIHPERRITIYDVAKAAGVSPSTVSRALSRPGRISAHTARKVRAAAQELGYYRSPSAPAKEATELKLLLMLVNDIGNPVFLELIRGVESIAEGAGYTTVILDSRESIARERLAEELFPAIDGVLLTSPRLSDQGIRMLAKSRPLVVLNRVVGGVPSILADTARGARAAAEHLHEFGHTQITYLAGPRASWADGMRWRSLQEACRDMSIRVRRIGPYIPTITGGLMATKEWARFPTTGVVAFNDVIAIGFIQGLRNMHIEVPKDVSVVGFDNSQVGSVITPTLTTLAAPSRSQGETAVRNLIAIIDGAQPSGNPVYLPTKLIPRASTSEANDAVVASL